MRLFHILLLTILMHGIVLPSTPASNQPATPSTQGCTKFAPVPYAQQITSSQLPAQTKQAVKAAWGNLYAGYLARSASKQSSHSWQALKQRATAGNTLCNYPPLNQPSDDIQNLKICFDPPTTGQSVNTTTCQNNVTNMYNALNNNALTMMYDYVSPKTFPKLPDDKQGYKYNYATHHLHRALNRLAQTCTITHANNQPATSCTNNIKDLGIIVNITNNTNTLFGMYQVNHQEVCIGTLSHGLNGVNLHTAALQYDAQDPQAPTNNTSREQISTGHFAFYEFAPNTNKPISNTPLFTIQMMTGSEIKNFLDTLTHDLENNTFEMNGRPTSRQYLADDQDLYMLMIQNPTPRNQITRNIDQRIQAINLSTLQGPYLLNMQINEKDHTFITSDNNLSETRKIYQPAFTTVQVLQSPVKHITPLPLPILSDYLWNIPDLQLLWMLHASSYIAAATDFSFFGTGNFGSAFEYFHKLGYFETSNEYIYFIDKYNLTKPGQTLYDVNWLMSCNTYETNLDNCNNIPQLHPTQNSKNNIIANGYAAFHINFRITFPPITPEKPTVKLFNRNGFNSMFDMPYHQIYTFISSLPTKKMKESVFAKITKQKNGSFTLTWLDKQGNMLAIQTLSFSDLKKHNFVKFLTQSNTWHGSEIPIDLTSLKQNESAEFKVTYKDKDKFLLQASKTSPIDHTELIFNINITQYPLTNLYYDVFNIFNVEPYTRCHILESGNLPKFLQNLTELDWKQGIYIVPSVKNNQLLNSNDRGKLTVTFYKSDKTLLGSITTKGKNIKTNVPGIPEPVKLYNLSSKNFDTFQEASLDVGVKITYTPTVNNM